MGRIQEGGVLTQKVSMTIGAVALLMIGAFLCCPLMADTTAGEGVYVVNVEASADYCGVNSSLTGSDLNEVVCTLSGNERYYYKATLLNSDDVSSGKINNITTEDAATKQVTPTDASSGQLDNSNNRTVYVVAPLESGEYRLVVKFYGKNDSDMTGEVLAEKTVPLKVVDPVVLKFTLKNDSSNGVTFSAFFVIDGVKADKSVQSVTVPANGTKDVTYNYYMKDVKDSKYYLDTDSDYIKGIIKGMGEENTKTFYAHDADYTVITTIVIVVLVILAIILFFVMRKPVINKGKPKGRR